MGNRNLQSMANPRWLWWGGTIFAILLLLIIGFRAVLPAVAGRLVGKAMGVPVSIGTLEVSFLGDNLVVENIRVAQPEGFGDEPMVQVGRIAVDGWLGALSDPRRIADVRVDDVRVEVIAKADGTSSLATLLDSMNADKGSAATEDESEPAELASILVDRVFVNSVTLIRREQLESGEEYRLEMLGDQLTINRLAMGDIADAEPGDIEFTGGILQPGLERAKIYLAGRFSRLGTGAGNLRVSARVTGCLFNTFVPIIPENTGTLLGGNGFDADLEAKVAGGMIDVLGNATTSVGSTYTIAIGGPVAAPEVNLPKKLLAVTSRMTGGAGRLVRSTLGTGGELLQGTAKSVGALGKGTLSAVGNVLKGAGQTAAGVVTADAEKIKSGAGTMTVEAGGSVVDAVGDTANEIGDTGGNAVGAVAKDPKTLKWLEGIPLRHRERVDGLMAGILAEEFPPAVETPTEADRE